MDTHRSPDQRAALLVATMTLAQEVQETATISTATQSREVPGIPALCVPALLLTNGPAGVFANPVHAYTRRLIESVPRIRTEAS